MLLKDIHDRCAAGEVVICESINDQLPEDYVKRNPQHFANLVIDDDITQAGVLFIYDPAVREKHEFNPVKGVS